MGWQDGTPVESKQPAWMVGAPVTPAAPSMTDVVLNAASKGIAAIPDTLLNAPQNVANLGRAAFGAAAGALGRPDLMPDLTPNPDYARRGLEAVGAIRPEIVPQGPIQRGVDVLTQGAVAGALTGGTTLPQAAMGAGMGALSAGAGAATEAMTDRPALAAITALAAPAGVGRAFGGPRATPRPAVQLLDREGVVMTPGQIRGGTAQRIEDALTSVPVAGDAIKMAQRRGIESFDRAAINRSLAPVGSELPRGLTGNQAIEWAHNRLGMAYDDLLPRLRGELDYAPTNALPSAPGQPAPPTLRQELDTIRQMGQGLPDTQRGQLERILDREIVQRFTGAGRASGETLKDVESKLGDIAKRYGRSDDYDVRTLGDAVQEAQAALRRMVTAVNPQAQGELARINEGYANFKRVQNAAGRVGTNEGVFTAAQLHSAVRAKDASKDKARFSEGNALMQDLSGAGKSVLSPTVPDSGTPLRSILWDMMKHPILGTLGGAAALPYTPAGQRILQSLLAHQHPEVSEVSGRVSPIVANDTLQALMRERGR
jgi:hypothetical protein